MGTFELICLIYFEAQALLYALFKIETIKYFIVIWYTL